MRIRRGLFRLWLVAAVLFALFIAASSYSEIAGDFRNANTDLNAIADKWGGHLLLPVTCGEARGAANADYEIGKDDGLCWYKAVDFRRLYPEYNDLQNGVLSDKLYTKVGRPPQRPHPWNKVLQTTGIALGVPVAVLILGASLLWAFAGFRSSPERAK